MSRDILREGIEHHRAGRIAEAEAAYRRALEQEADCADALNLLGVVLCQTGRNQQAVQYLERAVKLRPQDAACRNNLGLALQAAGAPEAAEKAFRRALALDPAYPEAHNNLGNLLLNQGRTEEAIAHYRQALTLRPAYAHAANNLGNALRRARRLGEAEASYRNAVNLDPGYAEAYRNLGGLLGGQARLSEALECFRRALRIRPGDHHAHSALLMHLHYDPALTPEAIFAEHLRWSRRHAAHLEAAARPHRNRRAPDRRLRLGYVSPDLRRHAVACFFEPVLRVHDRRQFEIFCYSDVLAPDDVTQRLAGLADCWRTVCGLSDEALADLVREDGIDILVDLAGHTAQNRLLAFARKPAPVQVSWLGYPNTTGLASVDYRVSDAQADPPGRTEHLHSERLMRLPKTFVCYGGPPEDLQAPAFDKTGEICFGSAHNPAKLNRPLLGLWARLLARVLRSRLLMKAGVLADAAVRERILAMLEEAGIERARVELIGPAEDLREHLAFYRRVDVALDAFPYHGTTTTCEALWMGVPVVSLIGRAHVSRVGCSLLSAVGLADLAADTPDAYVEAAAALAADPERLARLRLQLRARLREGSLGDAAGFTRALEAAYREMWRRWCSGLGSENCR